MKLSPPLNKSLKTHRLRRLVIMIWGLIGHWSLVIGHFIKPLLNKLDKLELLKVSLSALLAFILTFSPILPSFKLEHFKLLGALTSEASYITWTGAGSDNRWSNQDNWNEHVVPGADDIATFNGTSNKDVLVENDISVAGIDIAYEYKGKVKLTSTQRITVGTDGITQKGGTFDGGQTPIIVYGSVKVMAGRFIAPKEDLEIKQHLAVFTDQFDHNTGTIYFTGGDQVIVGSLSLNNFVKQVTAYHSLQFQSGSLITFKGKLTLTGTTTAPLDLRSSVDGQPASINVQGDSAVSFVDIKDIINIGNTISCPDTCRDSGNNTGWNLPALENAVLSPSASQTPRILSHIEKLFDINSTIMPAQTPPPVAIEELTALTEPPPPTMPNDSNITLPDDPGTLQPETDNNFLSDESVSFTIDIKPQAKEVVISPVTVISAEESEASADQSAETPTGDIPTDESPQASARNHTHLSLKSGLNNALTALQSRISKISTILGLPIAHAATDKNGAAAPDDQVIDADNNQPVAPEGGEDLSGTPDPSVSPEPELAVAPVEEPQPIEPYQVRVRVLDPRGKPAPQSITLSKIEGRTVVSLPGMENPMSPGKYVLEATVNIDGKDVTVTQDFTWGVLAMNVEQSSYRPGEEAAIGIGVLDDSGRTICDARLTLDITGRDSDGSDLGSWQLTTDNGIIRSPNCGPATVTIKPDYLALFVPPTAGEYTLNLTADTKNGIRTMQRSLVVSNTEPFVSQRATATRIFPDSDYASAITITATEDFRGDIYEPVPGNFKIKGVSTTGTIIFTDPGQTPYSITDSVGGPSSAETPGHPPDKGGEGGLENSPTPSVSVSAAPVVNTPGVPAPQSLGDVGSTQPVVNTPGVSAGPDSPGVDVGKPDSPSMVDSNANTPGVAAESASPGVGDIVDVGKPDSPVVREDDLQPIIDSINATWVRDFGATENPPVLNPVHPDTYQQPSDQDQYIVWQDVQIPAGQSLTIAYVYDAPNVSPQFYLLGALTLASSDGDILAEQTASQPNTETSNLWQEPLQWQVASDAARYWVGASTGATANWNTTASWSATSGGASGASVPTTSDAVYFDGGGGFVGGVVIDAAVNVGSITATAGYTGAGADDGHFNDATNNQAITVSGDVTLDNKQVSMGSGTWTVSGNWDDASVVTFNRNTSTLVLDGSSKTMTGAQELAKATISGSITTSFSGGRYFHDVVTVSGTFTVSSGDTLQLHWTGPGKLAVTSTGTITGNGGISLNDNPSIIQQDGVINVATLTFANHIPIIAAGTYDSPTVTFGTMSSPSKYWGFGAGTITFTGNVTFDHWQAGTATVNNSNNPNMVFRGNVTISETGGGTLVWTKGTGNIIFNGSTNQSINLLDKSVEDIVINKSSGTVTLTDGVTTESLTVTAGTLDLNSQAFTVSGAVSNDATIIARGNETISWTNDTNSGTVMYNGTGEYNGLKAGDAYNDLIINNGLVGYWKFDDGTGTTVAIDSSGYGYNGAAQDTTSWSSTNAVSLNYSNPYSLDFDGTTDYVTVSDNLDVTDTADLTISGWFNRRTFTTDDTILAKSNGQTASDTGYTLYLDDSTDRLIFAIQDGTDQYTLTSATAYTSAGWHHFGVVWDQDSAANSEIFLDGVDNDATDAGTIANIGDTSNAVNLTFGAESDAGVPFDGYLDDLRLYNTVLSEQEINTLAAGSISPTGTGLQLLDANLDVNGDLIINDGELDVSSSNYTINVAGSYENNGGAFNPRTSTVTLDGTSGSHELQSGGQAFNNLTISGSGGTWTLQDDLDVNGTYAQSNGTVNTGSGYNWSVHAADFDQTAGTFTPNTSSVTVDSASNQTIQAASSLYDLATEDPTENGLVGYWKFDEGQGTTAADSSGSGNTGTLTNSPKWTTTVTSTITYDNPYSLDFDGTNDYVSTSTVSYTNISISAWVKADTLSSNDFIVAATGTTDYFDVYNGQLQWKIGGGAEHTLGSGDAISTGQWRHLAGTADGTNLKLFIDGIEKLSEAQATSSTSKAFRIGSNDSSFWFDGKIDDVRVYNRALTPSEVEGLSQGRYADGASSNSVYTLGANLDVNGSTYLQSGELDVSSSNRTITNAGSWYGNGGGLNPRSGTITLDGTSGTNYLRTAAQPFNNLTISGSGGTWNLTDTLDVNGTYTQSNGTLDVTNFSLHAKDFDKTAGTLTTRDQTVVIDSTSNQTIQSNTAFTNLQIEDPSESNLVGYWKFDEGTGTIARDSSGNQKHGTLYSGPAWSTTVTSTITYDNPYSLDFDGTDDYVSIASTTFATQSSPFTVSSWFYLNDFSPNLYPKIVTLQSNTTYPWELTLSNQSSYLGVLIGSADVWARLKSDTAAVNLTGAWKHVTITYNGAGAGTASNFSGYLDGQSLVFSSAGAFSALTNSTAIGASAGGGSSNKFDGHIDDVRIYSAALTAPEIANLSDGYYANGDSGTATFTLNANLDVNNNLTLQSGVLDVSATPRNITLAKDWNNYGGASSFTDQTGNVTLDGTDQTIRGDTTFYNFSKTESADNSTDETLYFKYGQTTTIANTWTLNGRDTDDRINLRSTVNDVAWSVAPMGTRTLDTLDVRDSNNVSGTTINLCDGSINSGNNTAWSFSSAYTVAGTVYSNEGVSYLGSQTVSLATNGADDATTAESGAGNGTYSITPSTAINTGDVLTLYLEDETADGVTVTVAGTDGGSCGLTGIDIYQDRLIVRHDNAGALTNANLTTANVGTGNDGGAQTNDISNIYTISGGNPTIQAGKELFVWTGDTYTPGGAVTTHDLDVNGTFSPEANTVTASGSIDLTSGTFTEGSSWLVASGTGTESIITDDEQLWNFSLEGTAGEYILTGSFTVNNDMDVKYGYLYTAQDSVSDIFAVDDLTVHSDGAITVRRSSTAGGGAGQTIEVSGDLAVVNGGLISAEEEGFAADNGPGKPTNNTNDGGGYGGMGGDNTADGTTSTTYGSITAPTNLGSGGDNLKGGGAIILNVTGASAINGIINANGQVYENGCCGSGLGAGGSIYLTTGTLSGSGTLQANGGRRPYGGGGGGGRVAAILTGTAADFTGFSGTMTAYGGETWNNQHGAAGTVYKETEAQSAGTGELIIDNNDYELYGGANTLMPTSVNVNNFSTITIQNKGNLAIGSDDTLNLGTANISGEGAGNAFITIVNPAGVTFPNPYSIAGYTLNTDGVSAVTGDWIVTSTGGLSHSRNGTAETYKMNLTLTGNLTINSSGVINVDGTGYRFDQGPGKPTDNTSDGGGYGGIGGDNSGDGATATTYGSITAPTNLGSGGDTYLESGGGAIQLTVTGATTINGTISSNGHDYTGSGTYGLGSGGSVYLTTGTIAGSGVIQANGEGGGYGGGGGGGRVAVILTGASADFNGFSGTMTAYGGNTLTASEDGAAGTVYKQTTTQGTGGGELTIANFTGTSVASGVRTLISPTVNGTTVGDVIISNTGLLQMSAGTELAVDGYWNNSAGENLTAGEIVFTGTANTTIASGTKTFFDITVESTTGTTTLTDALEVDNKLWLSSGKLDLASQGLTMTGAQFVNDSTLMTRGNETIAGFTNDTDTGTVMYNGTGEYNGLKAGDAYHDLIINNGLVGYWKFDDGTGTTVAKDSSGYGYNGTAQDTTSWTANNAVSLNYTNPYALDFNGTTDYVTVSDNLDVTDTADLTISGWFNRRTFTTDDTILAKSNGQAAANTGYTLYIDDTTDQLVFAIQDGTDQYTLTSATTYTAAGWHHFAIVWDQDSAANSEIFLDGLDNNATDAGTIANIGDTSNAVNLTFGAESDAGVPFDGFLDDLKLYNTTLSEQEINTLAAGSISPTGTGLQLLDANLDVNGDLIINDGELDVSSSNYTINVAGSYENNGGAFNPRTSTVTLDGTSGSHELQSGGQAFNNLTVSGSGGTWTLNDDLDVNGTYAQSNGTVNTGSGYNWSVHANDFDQTAGTFTPNSSSVTVDSASNQTIQAASSLYDFAAEDPTETGLVGYWKFDEGQGTSAADSSGSGNTGTLTNSPKWSTTVTSTISYDNPYSLKFDGANDYVLVNSSFGLTNQITYSAWIKGTDAGGIWISTPVNGSDGGVDLWITGSKPRFRVQSGGQTNVDGSTSVDDGSWHSVVGTYDGANLNIYVDGVVNATPVAKSGNVNVSYNTTFLGAFSDAYYAGTNAWDGLLDDVRVYNRALTPSEVEGLSQGRYADGASSNSVYTLNANLDVNGSTYLQSGELDVSSSNYSITNAGSWYGNGGGLNPRSGTVTLDGTSGTNYLRTAAQPFNNLTISGSGGTWNLTDTLDVNGTYTQSNGTLDVTNFSLHAKDFDKTAGTLTTRDQTVVIDGTTNQTIQSNTAFNNLQIEDPTETSLVGYWKFDEGTGTVARDSSGNSNTGTLTNQPTWSTTVTSTITYDNPYSLDFDGTDDTVTVADSASLQLGYMTASAWVYFDDSGDTYQRIVDKTYNGEYAFYVNTDNQIGVALVTDVTSIDWIATTITIPASTWTHLLFTWDGTNIKLYKNGEYQNQTGLVGATIANSANTLYIGDRSGSDRSWNGLLDDIRIYSKALTAWEVGNLAAGRYADGDSGTATFTLNAALDVNGSMSIQSGVLDVSATPYNITVANNWNNYGGSSSFTDQTGTVTFDAADTGNTITTNGASFYNVILNNAAGGWSFAENATIANNLTVTAGTLSGNYDITVNGGSVTGNGTINLTAGTFLLDGTGNFGGSTNWNFFRLIFGDGTGAATTTKDGANTVTVSDQLKISTNQTLLAGSGTWDLTWGAGINLSDISQISSALYHSLALKSDGTRVYSWGRNNNGQLGNDTTTDSHIPIPVLGLSGTGYLGDTTNGGPISQIAAGSYHSLALKSDGTRVYAWGDNVQGQLGDNTTTDRDVPLQVLGLSDVGYLGDTTNGGPISQIAAGNYHSLALKSDGTRVYAWGDNAQGSLGDNTTTDKNEPLQVLGLGGTGFLGDTTNGGPISQIAAGYGHSLALKSDGTRVYSWGDNASGQLGINSTTDSLVPVPVLGLSGTGYLGDTTNGGPVSQIAANYYFSLALKSDNTRVYAWGENSSGQLGINSTTDSLVPAQVLGLSGTGFLGDTTNGGPISKITAGYITSFALKSDGTRVYAWGDNAFGQVGDNTTTDRLVPVQVLGLGAAGFLGDTTNGGPVSQIAGGYVHSLALKSDSTLLYSWGTNGYGQLGDATTGFNRTPIIVKKQTDATTVSRLSDISQISTNYFVSLALKSDGTRVYAWGHNTQGQLGNNTTVGSQVPLAVLGLSGTGFLGDTTNGGPISQIAAGYYHSLALKSDGTRVYAWGDNTQSQLGDNTTTDRLVPVQVLGLSDVGYLGDTTNGGPISQIAAGGFHSLALKSDGTRVYAWGDNAYGQLGDNTTTDKNEPLQVLGLGGTGFLGDTTNGGPISQISGGLYHSLALKSDNTLVYAWGRNNQGQLGNNSTSQSNVPIRVLGLGAAGYLGDTTNGGPISQIAAGSYHSLALKSDNTLVYSWGDNASGQLGINSTTDSLVPIRVLGLSGTGYLGDTTNGGPVSQIAANYYFSLALKSDGTRVYAWGDNAFGQIGDNTTTDKLVPVQVLGLSAAGFLGDTTNGGPVSQIAAGANNSLALKSDNTRAYSWGTNNYGVLGLNTVGAQYVPAEVETLMLAPLIINGVFTPQTSLIQYSGNFSSASMICYNSVASTTYYKLTANNSSGTYLLKGNATVSNNMSITAGTLDTDIANSYSLTVGGSWANSGTFTPRSGTVTLNGTSQSVSGSTTFYNLSKTVAAAATLTVASSSTQTVSNTLTLDGANGQLLTIASSTPGSRHTWDVTGGGASVSYLAVSDSNASSNDITCTSCTNSSNNDNAETTPFWIFSAAVTRSRIMIISLLNNLNSNLNLSPMYTSEVSPS